jgi:2,3-bisphosphoglycerate-dependent phosphoglycerate mutase
LLDRHRLQFPVIYLLRHGESEWNVARITQGQSAHPRLTVRGRDQVRTAATALRDGIAAEIIPTIVSSDLTRAVETANLVAAAFATSWTADVRLREQSLGAFEGLSYDESFARGSALDLSDPDARVPGGESRTEVAARMCAVLDDHVSTAALIVVSHGDAIRATLAQRTGTSDWIDVPNGSVAVLDKHNNLSWLPLSLR